MRILALLIGLLCSAPGWAATGSAAANTFFVRPVDACPFNGDGLAFDCAISDGASGAFRGMGSLIWTSTTGIDNGDVLKPCGRFVQTSANTASTNRAFLRIQGSGAVDAPIVIDGDCSEWMTNPGSWRDGLGQLRTGAVIEGDYTSGSCIRSEANTDLILRNIDISGCKDAGITAYSVASSEKATVKNITIESSVYVHDILGGASPFGITWSGSGGYIGHVVIEDIGDDGLNEYSGGGWLIEGAVIRRVSMTTELGDCVQLQRQYDLDEVVDVHCDHTNKDVKQCVVASVPDSGHEQDRVFVDKLDCYMKPNGSQSIGVYFEGAGRITSSFIKDAGTFGVVGALRDTTTVSATSNIIVNPTSGCFDVHKTSAGPAATILNNNCVLENATAGIDATGATASIVLRNNIVVGSAESGIIRGASGTTDSNNNVYGTFTNPYSDNGAVGVASAGGLSVDPHWIGGLAPTNKQMFRIDWQSPVRCAGANVGRFTDAMGRGMEPHCTPIGAAVYGRGDARATPLTARP